MATDFSLIKKFYKQLMPELTDESWNELAKVFSVRQLRKGDFVSRAGEICNAVSFFNKGLGRIYYTVHVKEGIAGFFREGEYISDYSSFLTRSPAHLSVDVLEDSEVLDLSYENLQIAYEKFPELQKFGRVMAEYLFIMVSDRTATLLLKTPEQRYLDFVKNSPELIQRVPQYMIASYLGITPEALSRIRKRLSK